MLFSIVHASRSGAKRDHSLSSSFQIFLVCNFSLLCLYYIAVLTTPTVKRKNALVPFGDECTRDEAMIM